VKSQWMLKITEYAQRLIDDLDEVDYIERVKTSQINWIGRSTGAEVSFKTTAGDELKVFTTRPDTLFGSTYMVISPEHPYLEKWKDKIKNFDEVLKYQELASKKSDFDRTEMAKEKTGVKLDGVCGINPANNKEIPVFVSDYVLMSYGTGAIMAVPAHDTRDWEFAKKFGAEIIEVVEGGDVQNEAYTDCSEGKMVNSEFLDGMSVAEAKKAIVKWLEDNNIGKETVNFKLRDWVFSRQRYWGEPIPIINCPHCGHVPLDEKELPLRLPNVECYEPTENGESPLSKIDEWVNVKCPVCGADAKRETDTMPQWAGSSWYYLRYCDPTNENAVASKEALEYWMPVDWYNGGMEHTTLHLLYSRFWHKFLFDIGVVPTKEPYSKRTSHGMILGEDNQKMSKSRGNVVNPDDVINEFGADTLRIYEMFIGDFEKSAPWSTSSIKGSKRFLDRVWALMDMVNDGEEYSEDLEAVVHRTIKKVTEDIEALKFNTAIAAMMALINEFYGKKSVTKGELRTVILLLNPFAPHMTEEMWNIMNFGGMISDHSFPKFDEGKCEDKTAEFVVQICGKIKARIKMPAGCTKEDIMKLALEETSVKSALDGKQIVKEIFVPGKL
ncbi:MAG: leucine--tRNA ligase, partial [Oscillospiraceae bacterium]